MHSRDRHRRRCSHPESRPARACRRLPTRRSWLAARARGREGVLGRMPRKARRNRSMAIRKVARLGHPVLREKTREVTREEISSPEMRRLVRDMIETMHEYGGVGLAAPQVHESIRLAIIE